MRMIKTPWALFLFLCVVGAVLHAEEADDDGDAIQAKGGTYYPWPPDEEGGGDPAWIYQLPLVVPGVTPDCAWGYTYKFPIGRDDDEMECGFWPDPCYATSWAQAVGPYIGGHGYALDRNIFNSASTATGASSAAELTVWRRDTQRCGSIFTLIMRPQFRVQCKIDPPAAAEAGGIQDMLSVTSGTHAVAKGVLSVSSADGNTGSVKVGPVQVRVSSATGNQSTRTFVDQKAAVYAARVDTILMLGVSYIADSADANVFNGRGEADSGIAAASAGLTLLATCANPCTKSVTITMR